MNICRVSAVATGSCPQIITVPGFMTFCRVSAVTTGSCP